LGAGYPRAVHGRSAVCDLLILLREGQISPAVAGVGVFLVLLRNWMAKSSGCECGSAHEMPSVHRRLRILCYDSSFALCPQLLVIKPPIFWKNSVLVTRDRYWSFSIWDKSRVFTRRLRVARPIRFELFISNGVEQPQYRAKSRLQCHPRPEREQSFPR
jgi:hypothetical protein